MCMFEFLCDGTFAKLDRLTSLCHFAVVVKFFRYSAMAAVCDVILVTQPSCNTAQTVICNTVQSLLQYK